MQGDARHKTPQDGAWSSTPTHLDHVSQSSQPPSRGRPMQGDARHKTPRDGAWSSTPTHPLVAPGQPLCYHGLSITVLLGQEDGTL